MVDAEKQRRLFSMDDMVVVAAGGAGAIGSALARGTAQFGAKVAIADVSEQAAGETAAGIAADTGAAALGVALDVRDADSVARIPMGRVCETDDLVGIGVFLASPASAFITGQNIFVDGGVTATQ